MKKLILITLLLWSAGIASAATKTCTASPCLFSSGTNWNGGTAPVDGDLIVTGAFAVTQDVAGRIIGDKAAATGIGASCSASGGSFTATAATTFRGFNNDGTAPSWKTVANCTMDVRGQTITYDGPSGTYVTAVNNGIYLSDASTVSDIPAGNITWSNAGSMVKAGVVWNYYDKVNGIFVFKIANGSTENPGPISNAANNGLGSFGDTSLSVTSGGFQGGTSVEKSGCLKGWTPTAVLTTNGDYCVDYKQAAVYAKSSSAVATFTLSYKYGSWGGWGILSLANAANNSATVGGTYGHCGAVAQTGEFLGGGLMFNDLFAPGIPTDATRILTFVSGTVFNYCSRPLMIQADHITGSNASHHYALNSPTFNYTQFASGIFQKGNIQIGVSFLDIPTMVLNSYADMFDGTARNSPTNVIITSPTGGTSVGHINFQTLPVGAVASSFNGATDLSGFNNGDLTGGSNVDGAFVSGGGSAGNLNSWLNDTVTHVYRSGRLGMYMDVENWQSTQTNHHAFVMESRTGYLDMSTTTFKNIITSDLNDANNFPGCVTVAYNQWQWIDKFTASHLTCNTGLRFFNFNDEESTNVISTRTQLINSIGSNNGQDIYRPTNGASTNISNVGVDEVDYNLRFNNTANSGKDIQQATFMQNGGWYNTNAGGLKTATGVTIYNPQGYTLPDATARSLVLTVAGTAGASGTKSVKLAWSGGTQVEYVQTQGVWTTTTNTGSCPAGNNVCPVLTDSVNTFPTAGSGLSTYMGLIVGGTGVGQSFSIGPNSLNTAHALTVFATTATGAFSPALDTTSVYVIFKPDQQLLDSGAVDSIRAQVNAINLQTANGTYTDANITMALNAPTAADPNYVNASFPTYNFHPRLSTLNGTASDGTFIGALSVTISSICSGIGHVGIANCTTQQIGQLRYPYPRFSAVR